MRWRVAALMTPDLIARRLKETGEADKVILPGLCQGDLTQLEAKYGVPVERGPADLKDLPQYFGHGGVAPDLSQYSVKIFAEIVDAPFLSVEGIIKRAQHYQAQGANVIDLGCLPAVPFPHLADAVKVLKALDFKVSVDSLNTDELLAAGRAGADYLLSLTENTLWIAAYYICSCFTDDTTPNSSFYLKKYWPPYFYTITVCDHDPHCTFP